MIFDGDLDAHLTTKLLFFFSWREETEKRMEQRVHLYCFQKSGMAAAQAGSTRTFTGSCGLTESQGGKEVEQEGRN